MSTVISDTRVTAGGVAWADSVQQLKGWMWRSMVGMAVLASEMSIFDHLEELRRRIIKSMIAIGVGLAICWTYTAQIVLFLRKPAALAGIRLVAIDSTEIFSVYFKVAAAAGICLASPVILWQVWRFIEPALYKHEKRWAAPFLLSTIACFATGAIFGYRVAAPWFLRLTAFWGKAVDIDITMSALSYFGLLTATVVAMGAVFEMPPIVFILSRIGLVDAAFLLRHTKYAVLIFAFVSAIVTPGGDLPPMLGFLSVMMAIYAVCIVLAWIFAKPRRTADVG
jgi:sec-independent protein translocase protein TatC